MLDSLGALLRAIQNRELDLGSNDFLILICEEMHDLAEAHPQLCPSMRSCVSALVELHQRPPDSLQPPIYGITYTRQRHLDWLVALCHLFSIDHSQGFLLVENLRDAPPSYGSDLDDLEHPEIEQIARDLPYSGGGDAVILQMEEPSKTEEDLSVPKS